MTDPEETYVVHLVGSEDSSPFKHFGARSSAVSFAQESANSGEIERADIYGIRGAKNPSAAVTAVKMGAAELIGSRAPRASEAQIASADKRTQKFRTSTDYLLKLLGL
jgi:phage tail tape-measure protein